jgi:hypothetical protein
MNKDGRVTGHSNNYSRISSSDSNIIYNSNNNIHNFKTNKEDGKHQDAEIEITSIEASKITQTTEDRGKENKKGKED